MQKEGHNGLTDLEREQPCKNFRGKNLLVSLVQFEEREKFENLFEK